MPNDISPREPIFKSEYLGDAVYASFDGYQLWLRTGDGRDQQIALDFGVMINLLRYAFRIWGNSLLKYFPL